jgi:hypothetical protein
MQFDSGLAGRSAVSPLRESWNNELGLSRAQRLTDGADPAVVDDGLRVREPSRARTAGIMFTRRRLP